MNSKYTLRAAALASTCLLPLAAFADEAPNYSSEATLGYQYQSAKSALFGKYNGSPFNGSSAIGSFSLDYSDAWDSGSTQYFKAQASGLGVDSHQIMPNASASVKYGQQGLWGLNLYYEGIPYWQSLTFHSLNTSSGALQNGLAPGSLSNPTLPAFTAVTTNPATGAVTGGGATPAQLGTAQAAYAAQYAVLNKFNGVQAVGTQRDIVGGGGSYRLDDWTFSAGLQHEHKQGTKENSFATNNSTFINYFPEPVDYDTDRYTASAKYSTKRLQGLFTYTFSNFTDNLTSFSTLNPFNFAKPVGYLATNYSLPPSNDAHMFKGQVAYAITPTTRLNANFGYSLMQQTSTDPLAFVGAPSSPYIPNNYKATNQDFFGNVALTARPLAKTDFRASYTIDDRKDDSARVFLPSLTKGSAACLASTNADGGSCDSPIANLPVSQLNQTAKLEGGYLLTPTTKVNGYYTYVDKQRTYSVTDRNHENTLGARVTTSLLEDVTGSAGYAHSVRTASDYDANAAWMANTFSDRNNPYLGMFYVAARTRDEIKGDLNWSPDARVSAGLSAKFTSDHYPDSFFGVTNAHTFSAGPDVAYTPTPALTTHFFYTYEEVYTGQNFSNSNSATANHTDWTVGNKDAIHTVGAKADWKVTEKVKISLEDNLSYGDTAFAEGYALIPNALTGAPQTAVPTNTTTVLPDDKMITNSIALTGEYKLQSNVSLLGQYGFERAVAKDYLYGQAAGSASNNGSSSLYSLPGDGNPSYAVHVVSMAVRVKW